LAGTFCGGWIGYFSYELGRYIERLPERAIDDLQIPLVRLCFHDRVIAYDHHADAFWLIVLELPDDSEKPVDKMLALERLLDQSRQVRPGEFARMRLENVDAAGIRRNMTREDYLSAVQRIKEYIRDGDVYQVNYSHRFEQPLAGRPIQLFHWQNHFNPSDYAAFLDAGDFQIVSASPELFVTIRDGVIQTKPIKGTRPRIDASDPRSAKLNEQQFNDLLTNEKEQAELNMIIDLERNDVARICKPGTRRVVQPRTIETYPTVFHAVATVAGELRDDITFPDVLQAMFPGGSITGAPKIRAMEIIDELEPTARGVYTGAIGYLGIDGTVCLNIAIRTIIINGERAFVQTGGGIVADSDPQAEWDETITKARALLAGIQAVRV
jgi:para-aminobenzoate synthetase component 1